MSLPPLTLNAWLRYDVVRSLIPPEVRTVLEIGCGQGAVGTRLASTYDYLGAEPDDTSFATAQRRLAALGRGEVRHGMSEDVLEPGRTFDLVCAFEVIEHLLDDEGALGEWMQRLRPGGWLLLSTPSSPERYGPFDELAGHYRRYEFDGMAALLAKVGFAEVRVIGYGAGLGHALEYGRDIVGRRRLKASTGRTKPIAPTASDPGSMALATGGSGRLLQPPDGLGPLTQAVTAPFRILQRRYPTSGPGMVAMARRPLS
jgi:SAM-dependent methyltransferase